MKYKYWIIYEYFPDEGTDGEYMDNKRRIYTFDTEPAANEVMECIIRNDFCKSNVGVEEYEAATKL